MTFAVHHVTNVPCFVLQLKNLHLHRQMLNDDASAYLIACLENISSLELNNCEIKDVGKLVEKIKLLPKPVRIFLSRILRLPKKLFENLTDKAVKEE